MFAGRESGADVFRLIFDRKTIGNTLLPTSWVIQVVLRDYHGMDIGSCKEILVALSGARIFRVYANA